MPKKKKNKNKNNNHNKLHYPVYYINLNRSTDRREYIEKQMQNNSISYTRIEAVDKLNITNNKIGKVDEFNYNNKCIYINEKNCPGQLGCIFSHFKTYITALKTNPDLEAIVVFEDDISLDYMKTWETSIKEIVQKAPDGWNTIQLHNLNPDLIVQLNDSNLNLYEKPYNVFEPEVYQFYGTGAYCISKKGMETLLKKYYIDNTIILEGNYNVADGLLYSLPQSYIYTKPLFYTNDEVFGSNIYDTTNEQGYKSTKLIKEILTKKKN
jgi:GR25 family glycosyltransferase involved in LPS biosynthesis